MKKLHYFILLFLISALPLNGQVPGITMNGDVQCRNAAFVSHFGDSLEYPRLNQFGDILYYPPVVRTDSIRQSGELSAIVFGNVLFDGWSVITSRGVELSTEPSFSSKSTFPSANETGVWNTNLSNLPYNRTCYVRTFAANAYGISYGDTLSFSTAIGPLIAGAMVQEDQTSNSVSIRIPILENGGHPISGTICAYAAEQPDSLVRCYNIPSTTNADIRSDLLGLSPGRSYDLVAIISNQRYSDTLRGNVTTESDLTLSAELLYEEYVPCDTGHVYHFIAHLHGNDPRKTEFNWQWSCNLGEWNAEDSLLHVNITDRTSHIGTITVTATLGDISLTAKTFCQMENIRDFYWFYVCKNEFLNTASITHYGIDSVAWVNENGDVVSHDFSVTLPTGNYTLYATDIYDCTRSEEVYMGKRPLFCTSPIAPGSNESGRKNGDVWEIDSISDIDGNWYSVVQIGGLCWMRQNLRTRTLPRTGEDLYQPYYNAYYPRMAYKEGTFPEKVAYYGGLYTWKAALNLSSGTDDFAVYPTSFPYQGICPDGWHLPDYSEWETLLTTVVRNYNPDLIIDPPFTNPSGPMGSNTPIFQLLMDDCYESVSSPLYEKEVYNASLMSMVRCGSPYTGQAIFWSGSPSMALSGAAISFNPIGYASKIPYPKSLTFYVRCVRQN